MTFLSDGCVCQEDHVRHVVVMGMYVKRIMCDMLQ